MTSMPEAQLGMRHYERACLDSDRLPPHEANRILGKE